MGGERYHSTIIVLANLVNDLLAKEVHALHSTHHRLWIPVASEWFLAARMRATSSLAPRA
jgi:hypothetical protein